MKPQIGEHWGPPLGVGAWLTLKTIPSLSVLPRRIWYFCLEGCVHKYKGTRKLGEVGPTLCGRGVADPLEIRPHVCYPAEFVRSRSKCTSVIEEKNLKI